MAEKAYTYDFSGQEAEEWRPVLDWEGLYEVSNLGRVRSLDRIVEHFAYGRTIRRKFRGKPMNPVLSKGYPHVRLSDGPRRRMAGLHVLVCEAFLGRRPPEHDAAHFDGDPCNPRLSNLRWATRQENMADCVRHGTRPFGDRHGRSKLTPEQASKIRSTWDSKELKRIADEFGIHVSHAHQIRRGTRYQMENC